MTQTPTAYWVLGNLVRMLRTGEQSDGRFAMFEIWTPPDPALAPPPHTHARGEESFFVVSGEIEVLAGTSWSTLEAGGFASIRPGTVHTFRNCGDGPSRVIVTFSPAGLEQFFTDPDVGIPVYGLIEHEFARPPSLGHDAISRAVAAIQRFDMALAAS
ncbi:MAG: cupin domain-containing protein [Phycisphaeraceae bacterium]|nr:cupin domain-containing protein [Phycisphaeraceae bacterium]